jgi:hypothetical protein
MPAKEFEMRLTPGGYVVVVVTIRDRATNDQKQNLRQRMKDPPDIAWVVDRGKMFQKYREA